MKKQIIVTLSLLLQLGVWTTYSNTPKMLEVSENLPKNGIINLNLKNVSIKKIFNLIEQQTNNKFIYMSDQKFLENKITIAVNNQDLVQVLDVLKTKANIDFKITKNGILVKELIPVKQKYAQDTRKITGTVLDQANAPIPGASVFIAETKIETLTDSNGKFALNVPVDATVLSFSYMGFETKTVNIENKNQISVVLSEAASQLEEIVVVGYGTEKKRNITASISSVKMEQIKSQPKSNVVEMLEGRLPGVQIMSDNSPGGGTSIRVRGFSTINNNDPLVIIDGVPASNGLNGINPADIETLQVLKDAASASIYGSRAANGVVVITTKKGDKNGKNKIQFDGYSGI
ncbi:MAG TPA: TonB-dependent receptor plug domain-containing protein, partial [Flavobacterium sp.]